MTDSNEQHLNAHFDNLLDLIEIEREAEKDENKRELEKYPLHIREAMGKTVTRLQIDDEDVGVGGIPLLILSRVAKIPSNSKMPQPGSFLNEMEGALSPFHAMNQGDNVLLTYPSQSGLEPVEGTLYDVSDFRVVVAINGLIPDPLPRGLCQLDMLGSDATYKRMRQAINLVRRSEKPDLVLLRNVCMGFASASQDSLKEVSLFNTRLNKFQIEAVKKCLAAKEVGLIHGPPGTGKTTVLVEVIVQAVKQGARVLASAPSNIAVDNMVEKLLPWDLRLVRMGHPARILEPLRHVTLAALEEESRARQEIQEMEEERHRLLTQLRRREDRGRGLAGDVRRALEQRIRELGQKARDSEFAIRRQIVRDAQVVLTTHGGTSQILSRHKFDLCVMDEASQATEPLSWIPISHAKKVVFAGDSCQLPPTIYSQEAAKRGLQQTLFDRLKTLLPTEFQTLLRVQYRMNESIMRFSSRQFYENKLIADESVKGHTLAGLPGVKRTAMTEKPIVFVDTAGAGYEEIWNELLESRENEGEAKLSIRLLNHLLEQGVPPWNIAIITPYVAQMKMIRRLSPIREIEIGSVDSFQGREKEAIVLSLVRSNDRGEVGFLNDTRRMNVAMTRARRLLIVIGDSATLCQHPFYRSFIDYVDHEHVHQSAWDWMTE